MSTDTATAPVSIPCCPDWCTEDGAPHGFRPLQDTMTLVSDHEGNVGSVNGNLGANDDYAPRSVYVYCQRWDRIDVSTGTITSTPLVAVGDSDPVSLTVDQVEQLIALLQQAVDRIERDQ